MVDTLFRKQDEPNASAEQQSAPVQPVSEEPVAPVTETAATDTDAQPSPPAEENCNAGFGGTVASRQTSRSEEKRPRPAAKVSAVSPKPSRNIQLRFSLFQRALPPSAHWS